MMDEQPPILESKMEWTDLDPFVDCKKLVQPPDIRMDNGIWHVNIGIYLNDPIFVIISLRDV